MLNRIVKNLTKGKKPYIIGFTIAGGIGGFLYWRIVGCTTGSCPIKSVWYFSTLYGLILGYLAGDLVSGFFHKKKKAESSYK
ncbi:MAG TPA: hypothetical protein DEQ09_00750 [Bacteroidales bacterium]|nr:hypothetical protein [Bacteroidales bacterium]